MIKEWLHIIFDTYEHEARRIEANYLGEGKCGIPPLGWIVINGRAYKKDCYGKPKRRRWIDKEV